MPVVQENGYLQAGTGLAYLNKRAINASEKNTVLVLGGGGFYGQYLVNDLLQHTDATIIVASRTPPAIWEGNERVQLAACDIHDLPTLETLARNCSVLVHCAGPFQELPIHPLRAAIHAGVNYVDISEDRIYFREVKLREELIRQADISVLSGFSVAPGMEAVFAHMLSGCFDQLCSVRTFAAPDTRKHRGPAMFHTMLMGVGRPFWQPKDGFLRLVRGWTEPEWVEFPPPIGKRLTHLVLEMADLDVLPELLGVQTVEFKAGTEWPFLNWLLGVAAQIRAATGYPEWERFSLLVRSISWLFGRLGKDAGGVVFEISGFSGKVMKTHRIALTSQHDGGIIPVLLASIGTIRLLYGGLTIKGIAPLHRWIDPGDLLIELQMRGIEIWWQGHGSNRWKPFESSDLSLPSKRTAS